MREEPEARNSRRIACASVTIPKKKSTSYHQLIAINNSTFP